MLEEEETRLYQELSVSSSTPYKVTRKKRVRTQNAQYSKRLKVQSPPVIREAEPLTSPSSDIDVSYFIQSFSDNIPP